MGHELNLVPDFTLFIQIGIFFAAYFVMNALIFKPYLGLLDAQKAKTSGLNEQSYRDKERAQKLQTDYEAFVKSERKKIATWSEDERRKVTDEERKIIQQARDAAAA